MKYLVRTDITEGQIPTWFKGISTFPTTPEVSYSAAAFYVWYHAVATALEVKDAHDLSHTYNGRPGIEWEGRLGDIIMQLWPDASRNMHQVLLNNFRSPGKQKGKNVANLVNKRSQPSLWWLAETYEFSGNAKVNFLDLELRDPLAGYTDPEHGINEIVTMDVNSAYPSISETIVSIVKPAGAPQITTGPEEKMPVFQSLHMDPDPEPYHTALTEDYPDSEGPTEPIQPGHTAVPQPGMTEGMPDEALELWRVFCEVYDRGRGTRSQNKEQIKAQLTGIEQCLRLLMKEISVLAELVDKL